MQTISPALLLAFAARLAPAVAAGHSLDEFVATRFANQLAARVRAAECDAVACPCACVQRR